MTDRLGEIVFPSELSVPCRLFWPPRPCSSHTALPLVYHYASIMAIWRDR